jgi:hypothetical protein
LPDYLSLFSAADGHRVIAEASVTYLYSRRAAQEILTFRPDAKILITLRNPFDRAVSDYQMQRRIGRVSAKFADCIAREQIEDEPPKHGKSTVFLASCYYQQVSRFVEAFGREQVLIVLFDDIGTADTFTRICHHLDIPNQQPTALPHENAAILPRVEILNQILHVSRLKLAVQKYFPRAIKEYAKRAYYTKAENPPALSFPSAVRDAFNNDINRLVSSFGLNISHWHR